MFYSCAKFLKGIEGRILWEKCAVVLSLEKLEVSVGLFLILVTKP